MYRQPLFPVMLKSPNILEYKHVQGPVLDIHELAAGKLSALFDRNASRDWFDAHSLLTQIPLEKQKLKLAFVTYLAITRINFSQMVPDQINFDLADVRNRLIPVMHQMSIARNTHELREWATTRIGELRERLADLVPLDTNEMLFISKIRNEGILLPELITNDNEIATKIISHPAINWVIKQR